MMEAHSKLLTVNETSGLVTVHQSTSQAKGIIILIHAMFRNSTYFTLPSGQSFVEFLTSQGFHVWRIDLPGCVNDENVDKALNIDSYVRFVAEVVTQIKKTNSQMPIFLIGHSLGGVISLIVCGQHKVAGGIAISSGVFSFLYPLSIGLFIRHYLQTLAAFVISEIFGHLPSRLFRLGNINAPRGYNRQYWSWVRNREMVSIDGTEDYCEILKKVSAPTLMIYGSCDFNFAPREAVQWLARSLGRTPQVLEVSKTQGFNYDADHFSTVYGKNAAIEVWPLIANWLQELTPT